MVGDSESIACLTSAFNFAIVVRQKPHWWGGRSLRRGASALLLSKCTRQIVATVLGGNVSEVEKLRRVRRQLLRDYRRD
jgi:hypothetical protein